MSANLRLGVAGLGTVGGGLVKLIAERQAELAQRSGRAIEVTAVSARARAKDRDLDLGRARWHEDPLALARDPEVDVVVELIGGAEDPAKALVEAALAAKKPVVTANKALIAHHGVAIARLAERQGTPFHFEAAVAGGIPIIKALREGLAGNRVQGLYGILNGTCNYILTTMRDTGRDFADVLAEAQKLGYAEADPSFDIDGLDTAHKLAILASVAFGVPVNIDAVHVDGIRGLSLDDIRYAEELGYRIKLLAIARRTPHGLEQRVHPCMVPLTTPIAHVGGAFNAVAVEGEPVGPFEYLGTRGDDPNDVFPHEDRRELRGLRVFSAWLNHDDSRAINTLDTWVEEDGRHFLRHHLIDFSSSLGSGSNARKEISGQNPRAGNEYILEAGPGLRSALTLGLWDRPWRRARYRVFPEVGRIEGDFFSPAQWRPEYPNPAFERMQAADAFWAGRIVSRFSDEAVRALVHAGGYDDPQAERYLADVLLKRRDKVVAWCFRQLDPLAEFAVETTGGAAALSFRNLGEEAGLAAVEGYDYAWLRYDNDTGATEPLAGAQGRTSARRLTLPAASARFLRLRLRTISAGERAWAKEVSVVLRHGDGWSVIGVERE